MKKQIFLLMAACLSYVVQAQTYIVTHVSGTYGSAGITGNGGPATAALMGGPWDVCADSVGNVYVLDQSLAGVRKINTSGIIDLHTGTGTVGYTGNGGPATAANVRTHNGGIASDANGNVYICEHWSHVIRKIDPSGIITHVAGTYNTSGFSGDGGPASAALLSFPSRIVVDMSGNIYFMDAGNNRVRKIDPSGTITTVAGNGSTTPSPDGLAATATSIDSWSSLAVDNSGNLFISLSDQRRIIKVGSSGIANTYAGSTATHPGPGPTLPPGGAGPAVDYPFWYVGDIAADKHGNLFLIDGAKICMIDPTGYIKRIGGALGVAGYSGNGGFALSAYMNPSYGLHVAENGDIYFVELFNQTLRKLVFANYAPSFTEGSLATLASCTPGTTFSLDTVLRVNDADSADTLVWTMLTPPVHGTASVSFSAGSNTGTIYTSGLIYTSAAGYVGLDSFTVDVYDGMEHASIVVRVTIMSPTTGVTGALSACMGYPAPVLYTASGGTWSVGNTAVATIDAATGMLTPVAPGTTTVTYQQYPGCFTTAVATVNTLPVISGPATLCSGTTTTFTTSQPGGTWSCDESWVATVTSGGDVTAISDPTYIVPMQVATITYTAPSGCYATQLTTVYATPTILSTSSACVDSWLSFATSYGPGTWSSSDTTVIMLDTSGFMYSASAGIATISYTAAGGCFDTAIIPVYANPVISGSLALCEGGSTTLSATPVGGSWTSYFPSSVTVSPTGLITAVYDHTYPVENQTSWIGYTAPTGCTAWVEVTASPTPAITGAGDVCQYGSMYLSVSTTGGGTWSSSDTSIAEIYGGGVDARAPGSAIISFTSAAGCSSTTTVNVLEVPVVSVQTDLCVGATYSLSASIPGTWVNYFPSVVSLSTGGVLTGISAGYAYPFFSASNGCTTGFPTTVHTPYPNFGIESVCENSTTTLYNYASGGTWASANTALATVDTAGNIYPVASGTVDITYTAPSTCQAVTQVTVLAAPSAISGPYVLCQGAGGTFFGPMPAYIGAGTWSSSDESIVKVKPVTGGYSTPGTGTATISYTSSNGCYTTAAVTVLALPAMPVITGSTTLPVGSTQTLTATPGGGTWSSSNTSRATVDAATGVMTGVSAGSVSIFYTVSNFCGNTTKGLRCNITALRPAGVVEGKELSFLLYPNPTTGLLNVDAPETADLSILSVDGKVVMTAQLIAGTNRVNLPVTLSPGIYICNIFSAPGEKNSYRIVVTAN